MVTMCLNPLKSGRCFNNENFNNFKSRTSVSIPLNRVGVSIELEVEIIKPKASVSIPLNRVGVSIVFTSL